MFGEAPDFKSSEAKNSHTVKASSERLHSSSFSSAYHIGGKPFPSLISSVFVVIFFSNNEKILGLLFCILKCSGVLEKEKG